MSRLPVFKTLLALGVFCLLGSGAFAQSMADSVSQELRRIFNKAQGAIVRVEGSDEHGRLCGTGFFIDPNGTLYTSYSVGGQSREITVSHGEITYPAIRLLADPRSGIAILKVEAPSTPFLVLGSSAELAVASPVVSVGYGMDLPLAPALGVVGGFDLKHMNRCFATAHIRANLPVQRGQAGAPMLNLNGQVVGILISSEERAGCYALPIEAAEKIRADFLRFGEVRPGWIGIDLGGVPAEPKPAIIQRLLPGSPAEQSGLQQGDQILRLGEHPVESSQDILNACFYLTAGDTTTVTVRRGQQTLSIPVKAGEHPALPQAAAKLPALGETVPLRIQR